MSESVGRRRSRELKTIAAMVRLWCRGHHGAGKGRGAPCAECRALIDYARERLSRCPFGEGKPTCAACPIHCYERRRRETVREVMRWSGPRMLLRHPILAVLHLIDERRLPPDRPAPRKSSGIHDG